jgi:hypothetical protein
MNSNSAPMAAMSEGGTRGRASPSIWLGYGQTGGRVSLRLDEMKQRLLIGGHRSADLSALLAYACRESDVKVLVLDTDGTVSRQASGYMEHYDYTCFLHDAFQIEEDDSTRHGQLIASAYCTALGLDSEEEAIVNATLHKLSAHDSIATPLVLFDAMDGVEGFRGFYVDKLKGRIGGLKFLESAENGSVRSLLSLSGSIVDLSSTRYPQAAELAAAVFLAKLLAMLPSAKSSPDVIIVTGAHRVFGGLPRIQHKERLLSEVLNSQATFVLASSQLHALSDSAWDAFPNKLLSSDAWNDQVEGRMGKRVREPVLPNACVLADAHFGHQRTFIARTFEHRFEPARRGANTTEGRRRNDDELTKIILEDIKRYQTPTRTSIVEFLSAEYGAEAVERELDRLFAAQCIKLESRDSKPGGHDMLVYAITPLGLQTLEGLSK